MAGFWIVVMALVGVIILLIIYAIIQLLTILSIIFSAVSMSKSKKYTALNGNYNYKSVKRFHSAAITFFVFGCLGFCFEGLMVFAYFFEAEEQTGGETLFMLLVLAKYAALFMLGIMSFKKFSAAAALNRSLYASYAAAVQNYGCQTPYGSNQGGNMQQGNHYAGQYPNVANTFGSPQQGGYSQNGGYTNYHTANNAPPQPNYQAAPPETSGFEGNHAAVNGVPAPIPVVVTDPVKQAQIAADKSAPSFSTYDNDKNNGSTDSNVNKEKLNETQQVQNTDIFTTTAEKRCSKCGVVNEEKSKFCTFCGEKL